MLVTKILLLPIALIKILQIPTPAPAKPVLLWILKSKWSIKPKEMPLEQLRAQIMPTTLLSKPKIKQIIQALN
jgi:hypothetical protein